MTGAPAGPEPPLVRDRQHVEREYGEQKWPAVERMIERHAAAEPAGGSSLARVHHRIVRDYAVRAEPWAGQDVLLAGARRTVGASLAVGGAERLIADAVVAACTPSTDLVLELGSGWGWHLLGAWLAGGPRSARYVAAELTTAGRRAAQLLAQLDPDLRFEALEFDYHAPRLDALGTVREAVVFSAHSIEQIPHLSPQVPRAIARLAPTVRCLHFEPVGWQLRGGNDEEAGAHSERHDYNRDLIDVLRGEETAGRLTIDGVHPDIVGLNPANPTTLVRWSVGV